MGQSIPCTFQNCKTTIYHNGAYAGCGCYKGIRSYIYHGGICIHAGGFDPSGFPGRPVLNYSMDPNFGIQDSGCSSLEMMGFSGGNMINQFGGGYSYDYPKDSDYGREMMVYASHGRPSQQKCSYCPEGECAIEKNAIESFILKRMIGVGGHLRYVR
ncbi:hypothetical protein EGR_00650 [Echinococcus granulosus]|uniref:Uncharacterized protein n=1 Tax=Echinococcus granulosus TaxID=6210 RepID=W6USU3_ECHGR|nr:hypothetical protein EGR_00650 [Echinococcus granulosus]EUB64700.1 hypothetical protein EGR_00650 [Echinococcus granulosus]